nr:G2/mitotic-specific cyclin S13-7-like [Ipomoea batatas]
MFLDIKKDLRESWKRRKDCEIPRKKKISFSEAYLKEWLQEPWFNIKIEELRESLLGGIKQKNMAAEGRNRRVLGDIWQYGYLRGAEGKQQLPQVSSPLTKGFCAQLLANAAADKNRVGGHNFPI